MADTTLYFKSLREQVYDYLKKSLNEGTIKPGDSIDMKEISERLGISRTPLRDALLQLEVEGFVKIFPRKGVVVRKLTVEDIRNFYEILGALESEVIITVAPLLRRQHIEAMKIYNKAMIEALEQDDFDLYYENNLHMHNVLLSLSKNQIMLRTIQLYKERLYDFPRKRGYVKEWEVTSTGEHATLIAYLEEGRYREAADYMRDVHWSFDVQKHFVDRYYIAEIASPEYVS